MKQTKRTLKLNRETIRNLQSNQLAGVVGGGATMPTIYTCGGCPTNFECTTVKCGGGGGGGTDTGTGRTIITTTIFL
jgi:hypothetical protein